MPKNSIKQIVFKNSFWIGIGEAFAKIAGFFVLVWIGRYFGPEIYGQWGFAYGFVVLFSIIADFGFSTFTTHEIAKDKNKTSQYIDNIIFIKIFLALITLGVLFIAVHFLHKEQIVISLIYFLGIYTVLNTFATFFQAIFRANQKMQYEALARILQSFSLLGLAAFFIWRYFSKFFISIDFSIIKNILRQSWPFALSAVAIIIYYHIDLVILGLFRSDVEVGYYNAAYNIVILLIVGVRIFIASLLPMLSKLYKQSQELFHYNVNDFFKFILFLSFPFVFFIFFNTDLVVNIIYGDEYREFTPVILQVLIWSVLILYNYAVFGIGLTASGKQKIYLRGVLYGALFNTILNFIIIPIYGFYGAAISTVATEMLVCTYITYKFMGQQMKPLFLFSGKIFLSALIMFTFIWILKLYNINIIISCSLGLIVYLFFVFIFKSFKQNLFSLFKKCFL